MYFGRHFRSADGEIPPLMCGILTPWGTLSTLTLPADNGTWGLGIITSGKDAALRGLKDIDTWMRTWRSFPLVAHWADGEPLDDEVEIMAKIEDRHRSFVVDGTPVATGVLAVADSWACTNPSLGRGASIGFMHAVALRDLLRVASIDFPMELAQRWHEVTDATVEPYYRATLDFDRHRLAEIDAGIEGKVYDPGDPQYEMSQALAGGRRQGSRGVPRVPRDRRGARRRPKRCSLDPGVFDKIVELGAGLARRAVARAEPRRVAGRRPPGPVEKTGSGDAYRFQRCDARRAGRGRGTTGRVAARLPRHEAAVVEAGPGAGRRRLPGDRSRPARLRRERQADRGRGVLDPVPRDRRDRDPRSPRPRARARRRARLGFGAIAWATAAFAPERVDHLVALSVGHPTAFAGWACRSARSRGTCCLFQFRDIAEQWLTMNDWANFREWSQHPDADAVIADLERDASLTPGLDWYRANITPQALDRSAAGAPAGAGADDGRLEQRRLGVARGTDDRFVEVLRELVPLRARRGARALDAVGGARPGEPLLLDFLPR